MVEDVSAHGAAVYRQWMVLLSLQAQEEYISVEERLVLRLGSVSEMAEVDALFVEGFCLVL